MTEEPLDPDRWRGVTFPTGGQFRLIGLTIDTHGVAKVEGYETRWDIWPQWLIIAQNARDAARQTRAVNPGVDEQPGFGESIVAETRHGMTSICALAFAFEAFTTSVIHHQPHVRPVPATVSKRRSSADGRIHQVWTRAFKVPNLQSKNARTPLQQIFRLRDVAVHPAASFVVPSPHGAFPVSVDPKVSMFRMENAVAACQFAETFLPYLLGRARGTDAEWLAWCASARDQISSDGAGTNS